MNGHCAYCGCDLAYKDMQVDHIVPIYNGGSDTIDNMFPACRSCNHYKSTLSIEVFKDRVEKMTFVLKRDNVTYKNALRFGKVKEINAPVIFYFERIGGQE